MRHVSRTIRSFGSLIQSGTMEGRVITCLRYKHLNEIQAAVREDIHLHIPNHVRRIYSFPHIPIVIAIIIFVFKRRTSHTSEHAPEHHRSRREVASSKVWRDECGEICGADSREHHSVRSPGSSRFIIVLTEASFTASIWTNTRLRSFARPVPVPLKPLGLQTSSSGQPVRH